MENEAPQGYPEQSSLMALASPKTRHGEAEQSLEEWSRYPPERQRLNEIPASGRRTPNRGGAE